MKATLCKCFALLLSFSIFKANAQTILTAGDIAFTGINSSDNTINGAALNDDITFVLLKNITAGTEIYFTDFGWQVTDQAFQSARPCGGGSTGQGSGAVSDGVVKWTATTNMTYGTQVLIRCKTNPTTDKGSIVGHQATYNTYTPPRYVDISTAGESIFAFQGTLASPVLLAGINANSSGWDNTLDRCTFTSVPSALPPALSTNNYAFTLTFTGNVRLKNSIPFTGNPVVDRAALANRNNWDMSSSAQALPSPNPVSLPLTITSFTGEASAQRNSLRWVVEGEMDIFSYEIQRSADGRSFQAIGIVKASGNASAQKSYTYTDAQPLSAFNYYRLKTVDVSGKESYSHTVITKVNVSSKLEVYPNPASGVIHVQFRSAADKLFIQDVAGRVVKTISVTSTGANLSTAIDISTLKSGIYFLKAGAESVQFAKQ